MFKYYWNLEKVNLSNGKQDNGWHFKNQNRISKPIQFLVLFSAVVIHIVVAVGFAYSNLRPFPNRDCTASQIIGFGILTIFYILALIIFIVRLWPVKDIFSIKTELIIVVFVTVPCFVTWIATIVAPTPGVASSWFAMLVVFLTFLVTICAPLYLSTRNEWNVIPEVDMDEMRILLSTDRASRATVDSEMSEKHPQPKEDTLARYLQNDIYCESFQMFCVQAWCVEVYFFIFFLVFFFFLFFFLKKDLKFIKKKKKLKLKISSSIYFIKIVKNILDFQIVNENKKLKECNNIILI